ncbi:MAG: UDP-glucose 4-epimerase GalE [Bacilli bacterium]
MTAVLVTGGAGYIGSHTVADLRSRGEEVVVIDNLQQGHRQAVMDCPLYETDIRDTDAVTEIVRRHDVESVVHFAAYSLVGESVKDPLKYYANNVGATERLLSALVDAGVRRFVFSSTAATYGEPTRTPIDEEHPTAPANPYGETKLAIERMLRWCHAAYGLQSVSLRYFNAAGAHPDLPIGEDHDPETHLIPLVIQAALGMRDNIAIFGVDYPTPDGTCIRDYIDVMDLAAAHRLALGRMRSGGAAEVFNLGIGKGFSVRDVIRAVERIAGVRVPVVEAPRRAGDPAILVAASGRAQSALGWMPVHDDLDAIIASAFAWRQKHPGGYRG